MSHVALRRWVLAIDGGAVVFFACFLVYTLVAGDHLEGLAREFVARKPVKYANPLVDSVDDFVRRPFVHRLVKGLQLARIEEEIARYRRDPVAYVTDLTRQPLPALAGVGGDGPVAQKLSLVKSRIRDFYIDTVERLLNDLRLFAGSNLILGGAAFMLACWARTPPRLDTLCQSLALLASIFYCSWMYWDSLTFFNISFRTQMGVTYPVTVLALASLFYFKHRKTVANFLRVPAEQN